MITYSNEDITTTSCKAIAHGVNCQGKMNSGVAKAIREKWPQAYEFYMAHYELCTKDGHNKYLLGSVAPAICGDKIIGNLLTQEFYGRDGKRYASPAAIKESMIRFIILLQIMNKKEKIKIAMPKIGCGLGGLDWETDVLPIIEQISLDHEVDFVVYDNGVKS